MVWIQINAKPTDIFLNFWVYNSTEVPTKIKILNGLNEPTISWKIDPPNCTILGSWVFEHLQKLYQSLKFVYQVIITYVGN